VNRTSPGTASSLKLTTKMASVPPSPIKAGTFRVLA
jgi:hypothetical protein